MLVGSQRAGNSFRSHPSSDDTVSAFWSSDCRGNGDGLLLSRSSLQLVEQSSLRELPLYDIGEETRLKSDGPCGAWPGEPATPGGTRDAFSSQSPICATRPAPGGTPPSTQSSHALDPLDEEPAEAWSGAATPRRRYSSSFGLGSSSALPASQCGRFLSFSSPAQSPFPTDLIAAWPSSSTASASVATPAVGDRPALPGQARPVLRFPAGNAAAIPVDARLRAMELQLMEQRATNKALARQLRERDEELAALRAQLRRLLAAEEERRHPHVAGRHSDSGADSDSATDGAAAAASHSEPPKPVAGLLSQLQRAREKLCARRQVAGAAAAADAGSSSRGAELPRPPCTPPPATTHAPCEVEVGVGAAGAAQEPEVADEAGAEAVCEEEEEEELQELPLGPVAEDVDAADAPAGDDDAETAAKVAEAVAAAAAATAAASPASQLRAAPSNALPSPPEQHPHPQAAAPAGAASPAQPAAEEPADAAAPAPAPTGGAIPAPAAALAAERRRTDRAHAALLSSSRQAARLAAQLAVLRAQAAELRQELADWRSACLDNHRQLARLRRAAAAAMPRPQPAWQ